jgi:hypothetical protein
MKIIHYYLTFSLQKLNILILHKKYSDMLKFTYHIGVCVLADFLSEGRIFLFLNKTLIPNVLIYFGLLCNVGIVKETELFLVESTFI